MTDYKLVPVEPTPQMMMAGGDTVKGSGLYVVEIAYIYRAMLAAAPVVQGEPVAWVTAGNVDGQIVNGKPRRIWWENNEGVGMPIYAAPRPTEQQPAPDVEALVDALTMARETIASALRANAPDYFTTDADIARHVVIQRIDTALAAHRKQGGEV